MAYYTLWSIFAIFLQHVLVVIADERALINHLLESYSPKARPIRNPAAPILVDTNLYVVSIDELDEKNQVLKIYAWFEMGWEDQYLKWDKKAWGGIDYIILPAKDVWIPDVVIHNSASEVYGNVLDDDRIFRVEVSHDGYVFFRTAGIIQTSCLIDLTFFPFDDQACGVEVDSWTYSNDQVRLLNNLSEIDFEFFRESGQWRRLGTSIDLATYDKDDGTGRRYDSVRYALYLRRKPLYYTYNVLVPSVLMSLVGLLIFQLPADSGEKVSLGITMLLSFSVFQLLIAESMPHSSDFLPLMSIFFISTMVLTGISLTCTVWILSVHYHSADLAVPPSIRRVIGVLARALRTDCRLRQDSAIKVRPAPDDGLNVSPNPKTWRGPDQPEVGREDMDLNGAESRLLAELRGLARDLAQLARARTEEDPDEARRKEWVEVARILDRFLFIVFLLVTILLSILLFAFIPLQKPHMPEVLVGSDLD